jgi:hypothetical protein
MELVHAPVKLIRKAFNFTITQFIKFFQQLFNRLLNLALNPIELLERVIDQFLDAFGGLFKLFINSSDNFIDVWLVGFLAHTISPLIIQFCV